jgi:hypothetical protein
VKSKTYAFGAAMALGAAACGLLAALVGGARPSGDARPVGPEAAATATTTQPAGVARAAADDHVKPLAVAAVPGETVSADVIVYGATPAGVMTAVSAARRGQAVALVEQTNHVGGVVSSGLVDTDIGDRTTVGGLAADFFRRTEAHYLKTYGKDSKQYERNRGGLKYEPHVAELTFDAMLAEQAPRVSIYKRHRVVAAKVDDGRIESLTAETVDAAGKVTGARAFRGVVFVDASYTGDLMARAGVPYRLGREARAEYGEIMAGISAGPKEALGASDHRTQAFNYRVSVTSNTARRIPFPKPDNYDPEPWRGDGRRIRELGIDRFENMYAAGERKAGPNDKYDSNWCDLTGGSEGYAEADYETRARIEQKHKDYFLSRLYYLANDPEIPEAFRKNAQTWGLPSDEFVDNGHFPFQLYVRAARRMIGRYVLTQDDLTQNRFKPDGIATGGYGIDCHPVQRVLVNGRWDVDRTRHMSVDNYDLPYATMTPVEPGNLLVPVCLSASHIAYCSLRMEPVFMMLGQAAGNAAHLAVAKGTSVQDVDVQALRGLLREEGAILDAGYMPQVSIAFAPAHPKPGEVVTFRATRGPLLKEPLTKLAWDFEGAGRVGAEGDEARFSFSLEKRYTVSLVVTDEAGRRRLVTADVPVGAARADAADVTVDEFDAEMVGRWEAAYLELPLNAKGVATRITPDVFFGPGAHFSGPRGGGPGGPVRATFKTTLPRAGRYEIAVASRPSPKMATNVPVLVRHADGDARVSLDQRNTLSPFPFTSVGTFRFAAGNGAFVELTNAGADGRITADAVRWIWVGE